MQEHSNAQPSQNVFSYTSLICFYFLSLPKKGEHAHLFVLLKISSPLRP